MAQVDGVSDIETDIASRICKFKLAKNDLDIKAKLNELAVSNEHIAGFQIVEGIN